jgi:hypothetical protein
VHHGALPSPPPQILLSGRAFHLPFFQLSGSAEMASDTGRPSRRSNLLKLPIAFSSLAVAAIVLLSYLYGDSSVPQAPSIKRPVTQDVVVSLEEPESYNHTLYRRLDPYSCTKDIPCHTVACCETNYPIESFPSKVCYRRLFLRG